MAFDAFDLAATYVDNNLIELRVGIYFGVETILEVKKQLSKQPCEMMK